MLEVVMIKVLLGCDFMESQLSFMNYYLSMKCGEFWKRVGNIPTSCGTIAWNSYSYKLGGISIRLCLLDF